MKFKSLFQGLLLSCAGFFGSHAALAQSGLNVYINNFQANGNGCPAGSYSYILTPDKSTLQIIFSDFIAELAPIGSLVSHPPTTTCTIALQLHLPPGIALSWYSTEHRGFADTSGGAYGQFWARYYLPGTGGFDTVKIYPIRTGTVASYTVINNDLGGTWTRCGGNQLMSLNTRIRLAGNPYAYNTITVDDQTQRVETLLRFRYRSCI